MSDSISNREALLPAVHHNVHHVSIQVANHADSAYYAPGYPSGLTDSVIPLGRKAEQLSEMTVMEKYAGREPEPYMASPIHSSGILSLLIISFLIIAFCYRTGSKYFKSIIPDLFSVKREDSMEPRTSSETITMSALILQMAIIGGLIAYCFVLHYNPEVLPLNVDMSILSFILVAGVYYFLQLAVLRLIGFIFAKRIQTAMWIRCFNASQTLSGMLLAPAAMVMLFLPDYTEQALTVAACLYCFIRLSFLVKSFMLFFQNIFQSVYFILYLCGVEIIPIILAFKYVLLMPNLLEKSLL